MHRKQLQCQLFVTKELKGKGFEKTKSFFTYMNIVERDHEIQSRKDEESV